MTIEGGSKRHPTGKIAIDGKTEIQELGEGRWTHHRTLDPVRAAALTAAADLYGHLYHGTTDRLQIEALVITARTFEQYLTGEEANG